MLLWTVLLPGQSCQGLCFIFSSCLAIAFPAPQPVVSSSPSSLPGALPQFGPPRAQCAMEEQPSTALQAFGVIPGGGRNSKELWQ